MRGIFFGGAEAVMLFFLLSGIVLTLAYGDTLNFVPAKRFWAGRLARAVPMAWLSVLLLLPVGVQRMKVCARPHYRWDLSATEVLTLQTVTQLLFLESWLPLDIDNGMMNQPLWALGTFGIFWVTRLGP